MYAFSFFCDKNQEYFINKMKGVKTKFKYGKLIK